MIKRSFFPFFLTILLNVSGFAFTDSTYIAQFNISIISAEDDMEERSDGTIYHGSSDIELAEDLDPVNGVQTVGLRFQNIPIPQGAIVQEAFLQFTVDEYSAGNCNLILRGEASDDANPFNTSAFQNISTRPLTSASAAWSPLAWTIIDESDQFQRSPNISALIQEVINRPGWQEGQALSIIINGNGTRVARSYETNPQQAAKLILKAVSYTHLTLPTTPYV